jgi:hypothetical protein
LLVVFGLVVLPAVAQAQVTLAGVVKDASGAVLPGVTVEASSPALIEKVRSAVTEGSGQYRITDLAPGAYSVAYTLPGFAKVVRDGLTFSGSGAVTIDIEMRVGGLEETLTVTGESPVVDVQTTRRETVLSNDVVQSLPATRSCQLRVGSSPTSQGSRRPAASAPRPTRARSTGSPHTGAGRTKGASRSTA